jgi:hypothetical protein
VTEIPSLTVGRELVSLGRNVDLSLKKSSPDAARTRISIRLAVTWAASRSSMGGGGGGKPRDYIGWCRRFAKAAPLVLGDAFAVAAGFTMTVITAD